MKIKLSVLLLFTLFFSRFVIAQTCSVLGQTPSTAFPVCGTTVFQQTTVPICSSANLFVPGCSGDGASYQDKNPFYYVFTCYGAGTLGFLITPNNSGDDYDWQLYDITGHNPNDIYTDKSLIVTANWAGTYGATGASATGVNYIQCASDPAANLPSFSSMPQLKQGHVYLLMVSHFTNSQSGYALSFGGGTAVITDPLKPHMQKVVPDCNGQKLTLKLNKQIRCNSLSADGSEFVIAPASSVPTSAVAPLCSVSFDMDSVIITLNNPLPSGSYQLVIKNGSDGNTLLDDCGNAITVGEAIDFQYIIPQPILADSVGRIGCAPDSILVYYPKKINCSSISSSGSDFAITGPTPVTIASASGNCINGQTDYIILKLSSPIYTGGTYTVIMQPGLDGSPVYDVCGQPILPQTLSISAADTVSADFTYTTLLGCRMNSLTFMHNGANAVNQWNWTINNTTRVSTQTTTQSFPSTSSNTVKLNVSNGTCSDSTSQSIIFNNEVKADFDMPDIICPEDALTVTDKSSGTINSWNWKFDIVANSNLQNPPPQNFPLNNRETLYNIKLLVSNTLLNCTDSLTKYLKVLDNCLIAVPSAFTPNSDGLNDFFWPHNAIKADNLEFKVFNRWGQMVFNTTNWQQKWDGTIKGVQQPSGVYVWFLSYTNRDTGKKVFQKGTVMLIR
ncbi:MAG: gliding motility-associated C-terminal domain-containing protein [Bacteroidetes bacterium]|nr:gliding motility-associated C-terminal domain-containing protein [Bacteroidota bacterium]MBS1632517.1 gliding motility-associated C-terminal domain-containing protein [Bacteroidota bacterium]